MRKIIVTVAPVAGEISEDLVASLCPSKIAIDVISAAETGASMVHLHVRNKVNNHIEDIIQARSFVI